MQRIIISTADTFTVPAVSYVCIAIMWCVLGTLMVDGFLLFDIKYGISSYVVSLFYALLLLMTGILMWVYKIQKIDSLIFLSIANFFFCLFLIDLFMPADEIIAGNYGRGELVWQNFSVIYGFAP